MFGYVYLVRNKINGKQYIGQKHSEVFVENYYGSGVYLTRALNKYGIENFEHVAILEWCETKEDLDNSEKYWIDYYNAVDSNDFYNLAKGGIGTTAGSKRSDTFKAKIAEATSRRVWTDESRAKISNAIKGRVWVNNSIEEKQVTLDEYGILIEQGYSKGRLPFTNEHCKNLSESNKGRIHSEEQLKKQSERVSGDKNPFYGKHHTEDQRNKWKQLRKEMVWVHKDGVNTVIHKNKLSEYLLDGWTRGMLKKKSSTTIESIGNKKDITE